MTPRTEITRDDIMPMEAFADVRMQKRQEISAIKRNRRMEIGPVATAYFENYDTMWWQIHEMLFIEKGGEEQIPDELSAYNPLIPKGRELVCTVMFEIDDPMRRATFLGKLGGVEDTMFVQIGNETMRGVPEQDVDRTSAAGKASSVQFIHVPFTDEQAARFRADGAQVIVGFDHPHYSHMAVMPEPVRQSLAGDFA
jgi:hypothetical protein